MLTFNCTASTAERVRNLSTPGFVIIDSSFLAVSEYGQISEHLDNRNYFCDFPKVYVDWLWTP